MIAADVSEITTDALNRLFESAGAELPTVAAVDATALDGGYGYLSRSFRLRVRWTGEGADGAPPTLVAKLPLQARLGAMTPDAVRMYRREAMFYRVVAPDARLRTPKAWVAEFDERTGAAVMVLEDLGAMESFRDDETVSIDRVETALVRLARLHARYWNGDELDRMDWLGRPAVSGVDQVSAERFGALWPQLVNSGAYELSSIQLRLGELLRTKMDGVYEALHAGPESLIHADLHQENLFFDGSEPVFIDWALAERANPAKDVAKLTASCLEPGTARWEQGGLIRRYVRALDAEGVAGVSFEEIERFVHLAMCHYLATLSFLSDRDFAALAEQPEARTDHTSSRVVAACNTEEVLAVVEEI